MRHTKILFVEAQRKLKVFIDNTTKEIFKY